MAPCVPFLIIFLFLQINILWCDDDDNQKKLIHIKELFSEKKYQDVLKVVVPIKNKNYAVCMIIAACYKELGEMTISHAYLQKAYVLGNYRQKLKIIQILTELEIKTGKQWYQELLQKILCLLDLVSMGELQFLLLLLLFLLLYVVPGKRVRTLFLLSFVVLVSGTITVKYRMNRPYAISLKETKMYSAPQEQAPIIGILAENNRVYYTEENELFYKIETLNKKRGWIYKDTIMPII